MKLDLKRVETVSRFWDDKEVITKEFKFDIEDVKGLNSIDIGLKFQDKKYIGFCFDISSAILQDRSIISIDRIIDEALKTALIIVQEREGVQNG